MDENLKGQTYDVMSSLLLQQIETNALLGSIRNILISTHLENKPEEEKARFLKSADEDLAKHRTSVTNLLIPVKK